MDSTNVNLWGMSELLNFTSLFMGPFHIPYSLGHGFIYAFLNVNNKSLTFKWFNNLLDSVPMISVSSYAFFSLPDELGYRCRKHDPLV